MPLRRKTKQRIKKSLKVVQPLADRIFSYPKVKNFTVGAANLFISRYAKYGEANDVAVPRPYQGPWSFMLDTPKLSKQTKRKVYVSGWFVAHEPEADIQMRLQTPSGKHIKIDSDIDRSDVASILRQRDRRPVSDKCGFGVNFEIKEDGEYFVEVKLGTAEWKKVTRIELSYDPDFLPGDIINPNLSENMAEHINLIDNKRRYFHEPASRAAYELDTSVDPKLVAFYLPQFHPFAENDEWWGKGFTEWSNVSATIPRYIGHEQPKLPADFGFYDLRYEDNIRQQFELAKQHGLYGFCFYYYWFSGKRLLEKPLDSVLHHKEWDFNFLICWANENWTRRWDGQQQDILIAQEHKPQDPLEFIQDVEPILLDERYIRVDGKPMLMVYRAHDLGEPKEYVKIWRDYFREKHALELHLVAVQSFSSEDATQFGFDKGLEFAPLSIASTLKKPIPSYDISPKMLDIKFTGAVYDYRKIALEYPDVQSDIPVYRSIMPSWDNDARKKGSGGVFQDANPDLYGRWLTKLVEQSHANKSAVADDNFIFINAWNEWAEGAYLEPDVQYGHGFLNRTSEVLAKFSQNQANKDNFPQFGLVKRPSTKLAVVIHLFYDDMWPTFARKLKALDSLDYDLFITMPDKSTDSVEAIREFKSDARIMVIPNRGRDVLPFIHLARRLREVGYEYVLKFHTKKSTHRADGDAWMDDMLRKLIPANENDLKALFAALENPDTGIIGPAGHYVSLGAYFGSNKSQIVIALDDTMGSKNTDKVLKNIERYGFFAGTMFWARLDAIAPVLDRYYQPSDFESEKGQVDGTWAHALERLFSLVPELTGKQLYAIDEGVVRPIAPDSASTDYTYAKNKSTD